jgi:adenylate cyclase
MQEKLSLLRENWKKRGLPEVNMRAGINSSTCMVGFIGSSIQMNFTCLGDGVNLAARLEGANKQYGTLVMISESVKKQLKEDSVPCRFLDYLAVKGKKEPIKVFEVVPKADAASSNWPIFLETYNQGIQNYLEKRWKKAEAAFRKALKSRCEDGPCKTYIERCKHFNEFPPPENWDGRFEMKTK